MGHFLLGLFSQREKGNSRFLCSSQKMLSRMMQKGKEEISKSLWHRLMKLQERDHDWMINYFYEEMVGLSTFMLVCLSSF